MTLIATTKIINTDLNTFSLIFIIAYAANNKWVIDQRIIKDYWPDEIMEGKSHTLGPLRNFITCLLIVNKQTAHCRKHLFSDQILK